MNFPTDYKNFDKVKSGHMSRGRGRVNMHGVNCNNFHGWFSRKDLLKRHQRNVNGILKTPPPEAKNVNATAVDVHTAAAAAVHGKI